MNRKAAGGRVFTNYHDEAWHTSLFRTALIALMAGSFAAGPIVLRFGLGGPWSGYLLPFAVVYGAAGALTTGLLGRPNWRDRRGAAFRLGEVILLLLFRGLAWVFAEGLPGPGEIKSWLASPGGFFTGEFAFASVTLLLSWGIAVATASDFRELAIQPDEVAARERHDWGESKSQWRVGLPRARAEIMQGFALRWIGLGALLVVSAGLTRIEFATNQEGMVRIGLRGLGIRNEVVGALVCYFLAGLLLLSHGRLAVLRGRWYNQEVEIGDSLIRRWHASSVVFVVLIALAALLLPLGTTGGLARALEWLIALLPRIAIAMVFLFTLLIALIAQLLRSIFGAGAEMLPEAQVPAPLPQAIPTQAEMTSRLPPWLGGALLWLAVGTLTVFLLLNFVRTSGLTQGTGGDWLIRWRLWWRSRRARAEASVRVVLSRARAPFHRRRVARTREPLVARRRDEPKLPREQVRRYYLAAAERAAAEGVARRAGQTPSEYADDLAGSWPDAHDDIGELTEAFLDARYSAHEIDAGKADGAKRVWQRLADRLRGPMKDRDASR